MNRPDEERGDDDDAGDGELLVLGSDAPAGLRSVLDGQRAEVEAFEHVSTSTDFERS